MTDLEQAKQSAHMAAKLQQVVTDLGMGDPKDTYIRELENAIKWLMDVCNASIDVTDPGRSIDVTDGHFSVATADARSLQICMHIQAGQKNVT